MMLNGQMTITNLLNDVITWIFEFCLFYYIAYEKSTIKWLVFIIFLIYYCCVLSPLEKYKLVITKL